MLRSLIEQHAEGREKLIVLLNFPNNPTGAVASRESLKRWVDYAKEHKIPIDQTKTKIYSRDRNLWHMSHEGADIEDPANEPGDGCLVMSVPVAKAPQRPEYLEIEFDAGLPVKLDRKSFRGKGHELIARLNNRGGQHAVGQTVMVENPLSLLMKLKVY